MRETPILFSAEMIKAIICKRKSQTRRIVKAFLPTEEAVRAKSGSGYGWMNSVDMGKPQSFRPVGPVWAVRDLGGPASIDCPYGKIGDRLWVKETWRPQQIDADGQILVRYAADDSTCCFYPPEDWQMPKAAARGNVSPLFMPRWASRCVVELTGARIERLQEVSDADAMAEGLIEWSDPPRVTRKHYGLSKADCWETSPVAAYRRIWESINGPGSWEKTSWVWALSFKRVESEVARA